MNYNLVELLSYSIAIPALLGLVRFNKVDRAFIPFLILLWVGLSNEIINTIVISSGNSNAINSNIYILAESFLIVLFFKNLNLFGHSRRVLYFIVSALLILWISEIFIISSIRRFSSYFTITTSFVYVLMSISMINRLIVGEIKTLIRNPVFLICIGVVMFFTYALLVEIFWFYGLNSSREFRIQVYRIMTYINLAVNLIYTLAVLWIPKKREYTLL